MSKICKECSTVNPDNAMFCGNCGKPLPRMVCPECGTEISTNFCTQCGRHAITDGWDCIDIEGRRYKTVKIGSQEWMAENLAVTKDRDGNELVLGEDYFYPNDDAKNIKEYGLLYTWNAAMRIAPKGWHLPSDDEWWELGNYCGEYYALDGNKDYIAKALAATKGWESSNYDYSVGNDQSKNYATGFGALPAGYYYGGDYTFGYALYWSATQSYYGYAYYRGLDYRFARVCRDDDCKSKGFSVRCLRD